MLIHMAALLLAADAPVARPQPIAAPSLQAQFDAANAAWTEARHLDAVKAYDLLEQRPAVRRGLAALGTVLTRKGDALLSLGRLDEAERALREGLATIPQDRTDLINDRWTAQYDLGMIALARLDYRGAAGEFQKALPLAAESDARARTLLALARSTMFDPGDAAMRHADEAVSIFQTSPGKDGKRQLAYLQTIRARIMLNHSKPKDAFSLLKKAVSAQGGLDLKVSYSEISTRSDLALAAIMSGDDASARQYLAYTGAGRISQMPFQRARDMTPPLCGGPADLKPDDVAVIEFAIRDNGAVGSVMPIYVSRNGPAAFEFARAVRNWSWWPGHISKIPPLFRLATRVELRCSMRAERPSIMRLLSDANDQWLAGTNILPGPEGASDAASIAPLKAELARREAAGNDLALVPVLIQLGNNGVTSKSESLTWLGRARDIAQRNKAPLRASMFIETSLAFLDKAQDRSAMENYRNALRKLLSRPGTSDDAELTALLTILITDPNGSIPGPSDTANLLRSVADNPRLAPTNPLRVGALIRLASLYRASGDTAGAATAFQRSGLGANQCALLDAQPRLRMSNAGSEDFPDTAQAWGFEGWVKTEHDISADGRTSGQRAIIAYPPFVFRDTAVGMAKKFVYEKSYRPDGGAGCTAANETITFNLPYLH